MKHNIFISINNFKSVWNEIIRVSNQYILMYNRKELLIDLDTPIPDYRNLLQEV